MDAPTATPNLDRHALVDRFGVAVPVADPDGELEQMLLDDLIELQAREALIEARRARTIEQLRRLGERRIAARASRSDDAAARSERPSADARGTATWNPRFIARRELAAELTTLLRESERTAETRIAHAELLGAQLSETADALARAVITPRHAQLIIDRACDLPVEARAKFERLALSAAEMLEKDGLRAAVVSAPCFELFAQQDQSYRDKVLGEAPRIGIRLICWSSFLVNFAFLSQTFSGKVSCPAFKSITARSSTVSSRPFKLRSFPISITSFPKIGSWLRSPP